VPITSPSKDKGLISLLESKRKKTNKKRTKMKEAM
tara:strand:- start:776 stop:880 length:105 start_codon:yes stop_codon:yes gene_type:complete